MWLGAGFSCGTNCLNPIDALERQPLILFATELYRRCPIAGRREEQAARIRAQLFLLLEAVVGVCAIFTRRENASFAALDRLTGLFVQHHHAICGGLQCARWHRIDGYTKCVVVRPETKFRRLRAVTTALQPSDQ